MAAAITAEDSPEPESTRSESQTSASQTLVSQPEESTPVSGESAEAGSSTDRLVAYFSYAENADLPDGVDASATASIQAWNGETTGNTAVIAAMIAEAAGADLFSHPNCGKISRQLRRIPSDQGQEELNADAPA